jgi:glycyl-tRNA synthetase beta chain
MEKAELLVELGTEEIPASMLEAAAQQFAQNLRQGLAEARLDATVQAVWYTPRRIIVGLGDIPDRQEDLLETIIGPPKKVAYDAQGSPTKAAISFAEKNGVKLSRIKIVQTPKGEYLSAVRKIRGLRTSAILKQLIPSAIASIQFPKAMTWTPDKFRFARPLRWIVALYAGSVVRFHVADVTSASFTVGHRFLGKARIPVSSLTTLAANLAANGVMVVPAEREARIRQGLEREAAARGGQVIPDEPLLKTVVNLNEYPSVICGSFDERFLTLPQEILVTVMREHQKYFSVTGRDGQLLPAFLAVINLEADNADKIRAGHERVLRARLADAAFFWETDRKIKLADRLNSLRNVLFQERLGSYFDKTERVSKLLPHLAGMAGLPDAVADLETAARMAKCDLVTEMVKEFTDLQGQVGGLYARAEGHPESIWRTVYEQYYPKSTNSPSPGTRTGALLALADRLDTVGGCFSVGLVPSGSGDPFAVRRQGNGIIKIILDHRLKLSLSRLIDCALSSYAVTASEDLTNDLKEFFEGRLRFILEEAGYAYDCVNAGLAVGTDDPLDAMERVRALQDMHNEPDFLSVASNFKRIVNILAQSSAAQDAPSTELMAEPAERSLWQSYLSARPAVEQARANHDYGSALSVLASMRETVDSFFDQVLVMAEDPAVRSNRLALLGQLSKLFLSVADISQIVLEKPA